MCKKTKEENQKNDRNSCLYSQAYVSIPMPDHEYSCIDERRYMDDGSHMQTTHKKKTRQRKMENQIAQGV